MMSNITPETTTYQQRYHQRNKRNAWKKLESIIMKIKKATKNGSSVIQQIVRKEKKKKEGMVEIYTRRYWKKKQKNKTV